MSIRKVAIAALVLAVAAGSPAMAKAKKKPKPVSKTYEMTLAPLPNPPSGTPSCVTPQTDGATQHAETLTVKGAGVLNIKVNGFAGDWDISLFDGQANNLAVGDGTSTGGGAPATAGEDILKYKNKKSGSRTFTIVTCNFAGSPKAHGEYLYTYS